MPGSGTLRFCGVSAGGSSRLKPIVVECFAAEPFAEMQQHFDRALWCFRSGFWFGIVVAADSCSSCSDSSGIRMLSSSVKLSLLSVMVGVFTSSSLLFGSLSPFFFSGTGVSGML